MDQLQDILKKDPPDDTFYYGERGNYIQNNKKIMIRTAEYTIEKENKLKKASIKNTFPLKEPGIRSTPNN